MAKLGFVVGVHRILLCRMAYLERRGRIQLLNVCWGKASR